MQIRNHLPGAHPLPLLAAADLPPQIGQSRGQGGGKFLWLQYEVQLVELRDNTLATLTAALSSPATVLFTDNQGNDLSRTMYVTGPTEPAKTVRGGNTYYSGVSFTLEEM